ncbi:MAG: hypothetical protein COV75_03230 [Candidatus Omnitrophica bacterium CG11_big_fil_rev_8_21_14_0_20_63_9]|nr:MAG: hypothetical protein COV75_03230 [Candidatus Omnitrophica bacterium CG11_big_fil_rev_8_21_14_0_20_63_9]
MSAFESPRPEDKVVILKRVPVFASCTDDQLHLIADRTRLVEYKKGELVYREGDAAEAFYVLSSGRLRVFSHSGAEEKTFAILHNGDSFGEISLLTGEVHSATVQALNDTLVLELQKKDFDDVINRIPSLVLHLSRMLSKRLRMREHGKEFAEATIAAIYSAATGVGRTCFAVSLASTLRRETGQPVVIVDFSGTDSNRVWFQHTQEPGALNRSLLEVASQGLFNAALSEHPLGFSVLLAGELLSTPGGDRAIAPLLSFLTDRFHYILIELPIEIDASVLKALSQADLVYLVTGPEEKQLIRTNALLHQLQASLGSAEHKMKIILNMLDGPGERLDIPEVKKRLEQPIAYVLPHIDGLLSPLTPAQLADVLATRGEAYALVVRRIARELGGLLVGLALGSGAALGLAHIGVLKVIEREKIPIDLIAGSSIGALVAGLWASGRSADELEQMALSFKNPWDVRRLFVLDLGIPIFSFFVGLAAGVGVGWLAGFWTGLLFGLVVCIAFGVVLGPLAGGPIQGARLMAKLQEDFAGKTFEDTWLPLKIIAANPMAREEVVFDSGPLADAVRASVSIPGIFKPIVRQGKVCLDGGVVNPIPVSVLKRSGAKHVIAINVFPTTPELTRHLQEVQRRRAERDAQFATKSFPVRVLMRIRQELIRSISPLVFDVIMRSMQSMEHQIAEVSCREADLILRPTVPGSHWLEFAHPEKFIRRGEEVAIQYLPELRRITHPPSVDNAPGPQ